MFVVIYYVVVGVSVVVGVYALAVGVYDRLRGNDDGEDGGSGPGGRGPEWHPPEDHGPPGDPEWWPEFERQFAAYVADVGAPRSRTRFQEPRPEQRSA